jgi:hypothetical protein
MLAEEAASWVMVEVRMDSRACKTHTTWRHHKHNVVLSHTEPASHMRHKGIQHRWCEPKGIVAGSGLCNNPRRSIIIYKANGATLAASLSDQTWVLSHGHCTLDLRLQQPG